MIVEGRDEEAKENEKWCEMPCLSLVHSMGRVEMRTGQIGVGGCWKKRDES